MVQLHLNIPQKLLYYLLFKTLNFIGVGKACNPITDLERPYEFQEVEVPIFQGNRHMKMVRLSALRTGRLYSPGNIPATHFYKRLSQPQSHNAVGRIMSMKNSNDILGNRTCDLPACGAVFQKLRHGVTLYWCNTGCIFLFYV